MKNNLLHHLIIGATLASCSQICGAEFFTLVAERPGPGSGDSRTITINEGDTAELKYSSATSASDPLRLVVTTQGMTFSLHTFVGGGVSPVKFSGPAQFRIYYPSDNPKNALATIEVNRAGTASNAAAIPQEAGTTWQVILEASTDMVNWSAVMPGDYPASSPQRYFRTRIVKRS